MTSTNRSAASWQTLYAVLHGESYQNMCQYSRPWLTRPSHHLLSRLSENSGRWQFIQTLMSWYHSTFPPAEQCMGTWSQRYWHTLVLWASPASGTSASTPYPITPITPWTIHSRASGSTLQWTPKSKRRGQNNAPWPVTLGASTSREAYSARQWFRATVFGPSS